MNDTPARRTIRNLIPVLFFLVFCLTLWFVSPCTWLIGESLFAEHCGLEVHNQTGQTVRVTPIHAEGDSYSAVRLYRTAFPVFPAYQQRDILVQPGDQVLLYFDCEQGVSGLYVCNPEGECHLFQRPYQKATLVSLESIPRPDAALQAAVQSLPEHNYRGPTNVLLCFVQIIALIGGVYWLIRTRPSEIRRFDI